MRTLAHTLAFALAATSALAQSGTYTKEPGIRVSAGSVPEIALYGSTYRLYFCGAGGILSAVSTDGINFTVEPGVRIAPGAQGSSEQIVCDPSIVRLPSGQVRMYYKGADGNGGPGQSNHRIFSATGSDGLAFTKEGLRFENMGYPDYGWTSVPDAVLMQDGRVRVYYTGGQGIESIISQDGLSFTWEPGSRITNGVDPDVIQRASGDFLLFYAVGLPAQSLSVARSSDGLSFTILGTIVTAGGTYDSQGTIDPSAIRLAGGRYRVYYGGMSSYGIMTLSAISPPVLRPWLHP